MGRIDFGSFEAAIVLRRRKHADKVFEILRRDVLRLNDETPPAGQMRLPLKLHVGQRVEGRDHC